MDSNFLLEIFENKNDIVLELIDDFFKVAKEKKGRKIINIAFSGGDNLSFFYKTFCYEAIKRNSRLSFINFFWVDETCVPPDSKESNFKQMNDLLFSKINVPGRNIHRIIGEGEPDVEAEKYARKINKIVPLYNGFPAFDFIILDVGKDGHIASLFPMSIGLYENEKSVIVAKCPDSGKKKITLTLPTIYNAKKIIFLITGHEKQEVVNTMLHRKKSDPLYPATFVKTEKGNVSLYMDSNAWSPKSGEIILSRL